VSFADGPCGNSHDGGAAVVHKEDGAWLNLTTAQQFAGPYGEDGAIPPPGGAVPPQPASMSIAKQISVPHGNSILALGGFGAPAQWSTVDMTQYGENPFPVVEGGGAPSAGFLDPYNDTGNAGNNPAFNKNPIQPLVDAREAQAAAASSPTWFIRWDVDTSVAGSVTNIPFEQGHAKVTSYLATYWLQSFADSGTPPDVSTYTQLSYTQTMTMKIKITAAGFAGTYSLPHVTSNVLTKN